MYKEGMIEWVLSDLEGFVQVWLQKR